MTILKRTLNRRAFVVSASAAGFAAFTGLNKIHAQNTSGKLKFVPLPDPLENCNIVWDASNFSYSVDEYLVSGYGPTFAPISDVEAGKADRPNTSIEWGHRDTAYAANIPADFSPRQQTGTGSYTTRIIVYRPRDMKTFSGNVICGAGTSRRWN
jgi:Alpha/beta hydrolase domain